MSSQRFRLSKGGLVDRSQSLSFDFDGRRYTGYQGDTLASALIANGVKLVARSFKYHRPRGIFSAGPEEPNALIRLRAGARAEPNVRATMVELYEGLYAQSQNRWPSLRFDINAANNLIGAFIPAGFYYKTFMQPSRFWEKYEYFIRRAAGMGTASRETDPDHYEKRHAHCDVLVVGSGASGLAAAQSAAETGARVILIEEMPELGGRLRRENIQIDDTPAMRWVSQVLGDLEARDNVTLLSRTTAFGYYDHNLIGAVERLSDHLPEPAPHQAQQRLWNIRAKRVIFATGAFEQPLVFAGNDRPGVMLAGSVRAYINEYAVAPGQRAVIHTNNDDAYRTAIDLKRAGIEIAALIDTRRNPSGDLVKEAQDLNIKLISGYGIAKVQGGVGGVKSVDIMPFGGTQTTRIHCDLIASSAGWAPAIHLYSQSGGKAKWNDDLNCFVPGEIKQATVSVGSSNGAFALSDRLEQGYSAGAEAASLCGYASSKSSIRATASIQQISPAEPIWDVTEKLGLSGKRFVDIQDDVTASDIALAHREGYVSVEHMKRYTTLGMGTDQGKTSNINGMGIMAGLRNMPIPQVGTTTFRPPYTPVSIGALGGADVGLHFQPIRRSPLHHIHDDLNCTWVDVGIWKRPRYYGKGSETMAQASHRETIGTRGSVGLCDVTTLGKIDIQGPDAAEFLNRVYANGFKKLAVGKARYGVMLREDGIVDDDGTTSRLSENHFLMTTTTAKAGPGMARMEYCLNVLWPELRVVVTTVTDQYAGIAVAGPNSRKLLAKLADIDVSNEGLPFMGVADCKLGDIPARLYRISFSGELAYEVNIPADYAEQAWKALMKAGDEFEVVAYGTECMATMRIEKGHVAGPELDGRATAADLGLGRMQSTKKEYIGRWLKEREALTTEGRKAIVGFVPADGKTALKQGAQIIEKADGKPPIPMIGHISSTAFSPEMDSPIALGFIEGGSARVGDTVYMAYPLKDIIVPVKVTSPHFIDPKGERLHG